MWCGGGHNEKYALQKKARSLGHILDADPDDVHILQKHQHNDGDSRLVGAAAPDAATGDLLRCRWRSCNTATGLQPGTTILQRRTLQNQPEVV